MAVITRGDLQYDYNWSTDKGDNPKITQSPDSDMLDRNEGYEMLRFLNFISFSRTHALTAERLIREHLPGSIRSRAKISEWLTKNWNNY